MRKIFAIAWKEIFDNLRDKRSVGMGLIYPIFWPIFVAGSLIAAVNIGNIDFEKETNVAITGQEHAPNLIEFMHQNNLEAIAAPDNPRTAVLNAEVPIVLEISPEYASQFREGKPAELTLYMNESDTKSQKAYRKVNAVLQQYDRKHNQLRMYARGIDSSIFDTLNLQKEDVSTEGKSGQMTGLMIPFLCIFSMIMGAFYLAIEITAGEREKNSLEPLLSLPVSRFQLVSGKYITLIAFMLLSLVVILISFGITFNLIPRDKIGSLFNFGVSNLGRTGLALIPLMFLLSGALIVISAFTKSSKEAQTYMGILIIFPMIPYFVMTFKTIPTKTEIMAIPILSQYKLVDKIFKNESIETFHYLLSAATTLLAGFLLFLVAVWLYKQDRILQ